MNLQEYQINAQRTADRRLSRNERFKQGALGLVGEAGEVIDLLKKHLYHGHPLQEEELSKELGDVMWYIADIASNAGLDLDDIGVANLAKLRKRYPAGFDSNLSLHRVE